MGMLGSNQSQFHLPSSSLLQPAAHPLCKGETLQGPRSQLDQVGPITQQRLVSDHLMFLMSLQRCVSTRSEVKTILLQGFLPGMWPCSHKCPGRGTGFQCVTGEAAQSQSIRKYPSLLEHFHSQSFTKQGIYRHGRHKLNSPGACSMARTGSTGGKRTKISTFTSHILLHKSRMGLRGCCTVVSLQSCTPGTPSVQHRGTHSNANATLPLYGCCFSWGE